jgi:hypothetical protein
MQITAEVTNLAIDGVPYQLSEPLEDFTEFQESEEESRGFKDMSLDVAREQLANFAAEKAGEFVQEKIAPPRTVEMPSIPQSPNRLPVIGMLLGLLGTSGVSSFEAATGMFRQLLGVEPTDTQTYVIAGLVVVYLLFSSKLMNFWQQLSQNRHELKVQTYNNLENGSTPDVKW